MELESAGQFSNTARAIFSVTRFVELLGYPVREHSDNCRLQIGVLAASLRGDKHNGVA